MPSRDDAWWRRLTGDRRALDAVLVAGGLLLTALAVQGSWTVLPAGVSGVAGVLASLAQWPRRRWPHLAVGAGAAGMALAGNPLPVLVGLSTGMRHGQRRLVWAYPVMAWAGFLGYSWLDGDGGPDATEALGWALVVGLVTAVGAYAAARTKLVESLRERALRAERERQLREEQARTAERTRIAREMHDVLAHKVSLIAVHAGALELLAAGDDRLRSSAGLIRTTAREALQELREVLGVLHADGSTQDGAPAVDAGKLARAAVAAGQPVELTDTAGPMPPATARVVNRIVQEGLTNARKHAPGAATTVAIRRDEPATVTVTVRNELRGIPLDLPGSGSGLVGLAERVRLVGGTLHSGPIGPPDTRRWELRAVVPWLEQKPDAEMPNGVDNQ